MYWPSAILYLPVVFILAWLITLGIREKVLNMIKTGGFVRPNFKGDKIPLAAGVIFFMVALVVIVLLYFLGPVDWRSEVPMFLFVVAGAACLGLLDDFLGTRDASGLGGHLKALLRGNLTTGAIKAIGVGLMALLVGAYLYPGQPVKILDSALIMALSANLINLFDLRPGRAGKIYILLYFILLPAFWNEPAGVLVTLMLGSVMAFLPVDLKARAMMGDVGSNTLGLVMGFTAAASLGGYERVTFLAFLIIIHVITEKYSLTKIIAASPVLNYLDMLGREKE